MMTIKKTPSFTSPKNSSPLYEAVETWIFDLDNTLYSASSNLFAQVDQRIGDFIATRFSLPSDEARQRQKRLFYDHGATLRGLMTEYGVDPQAFLDHVHNIDLSVLPPNPDLACALARLPGRKLVFTNAEARYAQRVLERLEIADQFSGIFDIVRAEYLPKPDPRPYRALVREYAVDPVHACMIDDLARNLTPAAALGMSTVWVRGNTRWSRPDDVASALTDYITDDLTAWLEDIVSNNSPSSG
ncbi:putative hydrolase of the HAD superfamily [Azospirillaceae bacterium]